MGGGEYVDHRPTWGGGGYVDPNWLLSSLVVYKS